MRIVLVLFLELCLCGAAREALAQPEGASLQGEEEKSRALFLEAETYYKLQKYEEALSRYEEAYLMFPKPGLLFNIGQCHRMLGRYQEALRSYRAFLRDAPDVSIRADVEALIAEIQARQEVREPTSVPAAPYGASSPVAPGFQPTETMPAKIPPGARPPIEVGGAPSVPPRLEAPVLRLKPRGAKKRRLAPRLVYGTAALGGALSLAAGVSFLAAKLKVGGLLAQNDPSLAKEIASLRKRARVSGTLFGVSAGAALLLGGVGFLLFFEQAQPFQVSMSPLGLALGGRF